jgi:hypothetical protein
MLKVSERYIVEIDIDDDGHAHMQVIGNKNGSLYQCINTITGPEAIDIYNKLINKEND